MPPITSNNNRFLETIHYGTKSSIKFDEGCLKQENDRNIHHKNIVTGFGTIKLTRNTNFNEYSHSWFDIRFSVRVSFSMSKSLRFSKYVITFGIKNSSSEHVDNRWYYNNSGCRLFKQQTNFCLNLRYSGISSYWQWVKNVSS